MEFWVLVPRDQEPYIQKSSWFLGSENLTVLGSQFLRTHVGFRFFQGTQKVHGLLSEKAVKGYVSIPLYLEMLKKAIIDRIPVP